MQIIQVRDRTALHKRMSSIRTRVLSSIKLGLPMAIVLVALATAPPATAQTEPFMSVACDGASLDSPSAQREALLTTPVVEHSSAMGLAGGRTPVEPQVGLTRITSPVPYGVSSGFDGKWSPTDRPGHPSGRHLAGQTPIAKAGRTSDWQRITTRGTGSGSPALSSSKADSAQSEGAENQGLATVIIGLFTAISTVGIMYLLARGGRARTERQAPSRGERETDSDVDRAATDERHGDGDSPTRSP